MKYKILKITLSLALLLQALIFLSSEKADASLVLENLVTPMTSNNSPNGTASASSELAGYPAWKAFNYSNASQADTWSTAQGVTTGWLQYEFTDAKIVKKYTLEQQRSHNGQNPGQRSPKNWTFEAWDGVQWVVLDTQSNVSDWIEGVKKEYTINNFNSYNKYRINVSANNTVDTYYHNLLAIGELELLGTKSPSEIVDLVASATSNTIELSWSTINDATNYVVKRSTSTGGPYLDIATGVTGTTYSDSTALVGVTYYYVVIAMNSSEQSGISNEASATIVPAPASSSAILTIYISGGQIKEYDLSAAELNAFLSWYDAKDAGSGPAKYKFTKTWNKGPFKTRNEYVIFDKILTFDVDEYEVTNP